jgi:hypothetical protein
MRRGRVKGYRIPERTQRDLSLARRLLRVAALDLRT